MLHRTLMLVLCCLVGVIPARAQTAPPSTTLTISGLASLVGAGSALLIFDMDAGGANFRTQWSLLTPSADDLRQRNVTIFPVLKLTTTPLPPSKGLQINYLNDVDMIAARAQYSCADTAFCIVLIGKDGASKLRAQSPVAASRLLDLTRPGSTPIEQAVAMASSNGYQAMLARPASGPVLLGDLIGVARPLLVFSMDAGDASFWAQWDSLTHHVAEMTARNVVVIPVLTMTTTPLPPARGLPVKRMDEVNMTHARTGYNCSSASFCVVLLGKDGGEKLRSTRPLTSQELITVIDGMPGRQEEMRQQNARPPSTAPAH